MSTTVQRVAQSVPEVGERAVIERTCARCVMDTTAADIRFDQHGICNYCTTYLRNRERLASGANKHEKLKLVIDKIRRDGRGKRYDCVIGVSGGADSTYVAYVVRSLELRPLAVHLDNGWDSELAVANIENTMKRMGIDLYTHVLDWNEFKDLQRSFLFASTPDTELPTDHAIRTVLLQTACEMNVGYILNGRNFSTEGILPIDWSYGPFDWKYLKNVHRRFGKVPLRTYPHLTLASLFYHYIVRGIKDINILNMVDYRKQEAMEVLKKELGWRDYGGKHHESTFTKFYQAHILPVKFNIDKRKAHYSVLVASGQMTRREALEALKQPPYLTNELTEHKRFFAKKLDLSEEDFDRIMTARRRSYKDYPNRSSVFVPDASNPYGKVFRLARSMRGPS